MTTTRAPADGVVAAVSRDGEHRFSKQPATAITLVVGLGVDGDAHLGRTVQHRSRVRRDPTQPNLRQVHLIHGELHDELADRGFVVEPAELGENVTTRGVDLLALPRGTRLHLGPDAIVEVTGLRNPCHQIDDFKRGLREAVLEKIPGGGVRRKAGVMSVVISGGQVSARDRIVVELPPEPHLPLLPV